MPTKPGRPRRKSPRPRAHASDAALASPAQQTLGMRLRLARVAARYYLADVAQQLGMTKQAVGHYEGDRTEPSIATLRALARLYNVTTDWLINGSESLLPPEQQSSKTYQLTIMIQAFANAGLHNLRAWIDADGTPRVEVLKEETAVTRR